jgi:hypothetical protein
VAFVCHTICDGFTGTTDNNCQAYAANAEVSGTRVVCSSAFYCTETMCAACDSQCVTCSGSGGSASECLACKTAAELIGTYCVCSARFFTTVMLAHVHLVIRTVRRVSEVL